MLTTPKSLHGQASEALGKAREKASTEKEGLYFPSILPDAEEFSYLVLFFPLQRREMSQRDGDDTVNAEGVTNHPCTL